MKKFVISYITNGVVVLNDIVLASSKQEAIESVKTDSLVCILSIVER